MTIVQNLQEAYLYARRGAKLVRWATWCKELKMEKYGSRPTPKAALI